MDDAVDAMRYASSAGLTKMTDLTDAQKNAIHQYRDRLVGLMNDAMAHPSFWSQSISTDPGTLTLKMMQDVHRQYQALTRFGSFHATNSKVRTIPRFDNFGTDYTTVDRMANPYRPGTAPHSAWMMAWVDAQHHWKTDRYQQHHAEVTEARDAMIESCAPVANWVDEVLFEVAEARDECEDVEGMGGYEPAATFFDEVFDFECSFDGPTPSSVSDHLWHLSMIIPPLPKDSITNISVV